jgi:glycosyltransferase involved in cell wall biosynthesis
MSETGWEAETEPPATKTATAPGAAPPDARPAIWLSLLLPVYDVEPYLAECVGSILAQNGPEGVEIILLDDGSTDGSRAVCEGLLALHCDIVRLLVHPRNRGLSAARNTLLEHARGDYVWFVDSDDALLPGAIPALRAIVAASAPDIVLCDYRKQDQPRVVSFRGPARRLQTDRAALVYGVFAARRLHVWSKICRRSLWGTDIRFPQGRCFEDMATIPWVLLRARSYYYAEEPWIFYRTRSDSIMARTSRTPSFDTRRNDDLAQALIGYPESLAAALPDAGPAAERAIARFCAKEFTKIGKRLLRTALRRNGWRAVAAELARYRRLIEAGSPIDFDAVARGYLRGGHPLKGIELAAYLLIARLP